MAQQVDRNGLLRTMTYDAVGRLKTIRFGATAAHPTAFTSTIENNWDGGGRLMLIIERTCTDPVAFPNCGAATVTSVITRAYDDFDHMIQEVTPQGEVDYAYDSVGRRTSMTLKNGPPGAQIIQPTITYSYDAADRLISISQAAGDINGGQMQTVSFAHDGAGHRTRTTLANGATLDYTYDDGGKIIAIIYKKADGSLIGDLQYEYDAAGRKSSVGGSLARMNLPTADVTDATYDAGDRLLIWAGKTYHYDDQGNLISDGDNDYQWDDRNRLASISSSGATVASFQYDSLGRRTGKTIGSTTTGFIDDHENVIQELSGITNSAAVKTHLLTGRIDEVFLRLDGNTGTSRQSVISDANNNTLALLDATQTSVASYTYEPYGATITDTTNNNTQQYSGRENDNPGSSPGLYYYRARYYMPSIGRFISEDPIGWASGQTNNYAYVGGNPINFIDPTGLGFWQNLTDFSAGFGDAVSFGLTRWARKKLGVNGAVNACSGWYSAGEVGGTVAQAVLLGAAAEAGAGGDVLQLFHGTDAESAVSILEGLDAEAASELGGGDIFWTTTERSTAEVFAEANPAGGIPALLRMEVPAQVVGSLVRQGLLSIDGTVYAFRAEAWNILNEFAEFSRIF